MPDGPTPSDRRLDKLRRHQRAVADSAMSGGNLTSDAGLSREVAYLWHAIDADPLFTAVLTTVSASTPNFDPSGWWEQHRDCNQFNDTALPPTSMERIAFSAWLVAKAGGGELDPSDIGMVLEGNDPDRYRMTEEHYATSARRTFLRQVASPLVSYLEGSVTVQSNVVYLLARYQRWLTWGQGESLLKEIEGDTKNAEAIAKTHLNEFMFLEGLNLIPEAEGPSGDPDFLAQLGGSDPFVNESKIFDGDRRGIAYLAGGVAQAFTYAHEWNEPCAYLTVFNITEKRLVFPTDGPTGEPPPRITKNDKTVLLVEFPLHDFGHASKQGRMNTVDINRDQLVIEVPAYE